LTPAEASALRDLSARLRLEREARLELEVALLDARAKADAANRARLRAVGRAKEYRERSREMAASALLKLDRRLRPCAYCGAPARSPVCYAHSDLLVADSLAPEVKG
jgi:hypothetical protein